MAAWGLPGVRGLVAIALFYDEAVGCARGYAYDCGGSVQVGLVLGIALHTPIAKIKQSAVD